MPLNSDLSPFTQGAQEDFVYAPDFELPDINEVQGDVFFTFPKTAQYFIFFDITNVPEFRRTFREFTLPTSKDSSGADRFQQRAGLNKLDVRDNTGDFYFDKGAMRQDKVMLGDGRDWDEVFDGGRVRGCLMVSAEDHVIIKGRARPPPYETKEHFGFRDGLSEPAVRGLIAKHRGQIEVDPGVVVMGYQGDPAFGRRPGWTKTGSIMVFRKLEQDVPEFDAWLKDKGKKWRYFLPPDFINVNPPLSDDEGAALLGARMFGRYKSWHCDPVVNRRKTRKKAEDYEWNNDFDYTDPRDPMPSARCCPFSAHTRKVAPRNLDPFVSKKILESAMIVRSGIAYGPEVTPLENRERRSSKDTKLRRGLLFVCYQSSLEHGFIRQTKDFANNDFFPMTSFTPKEHGKDSVLGGPPNPVQIKVLVNGGLLQQQIEVIGTAEMIDQDFDGIYPTPEFFVTSRGGDYFFVLSISTLRSWARG